MGLRVLLIDDNAERAAAVTAGLAADGCEVVALRVDFRRDLTRVG